MDTLITAHDEVFAAVGFVPFQPRKDAIDGEQGEADDI